VTGPAREHAEGRAVRRDRPAVGRLSRAFAVAVVALRYPILLAWIAAAAAATMYLPGMASSGAIGDLIPKGSPAVRAEYDAARLFGLPLTSEVAVVQRDPHGFPLKTQIAAVRLAAVVDQGQVRGIAGLAGALPIANTAGAFPGSRERSTTVITFLIFQPGTSIAAEAAGGRAFARRYVSARADHLVGVTGAAPARDTQGSIILSYLRWVELGTVLAIGLIVGLHFRSVGAPLATLACAATAYLVAVRVVAWAGLRAGITVPADLEPVLVVLLLGVTTDYSVFFLAGMRTRLIEGPRGPGGAGGRGGRTGMPRLRAARHTTAEFAPIIMAAGLVVAAGTASLAVARSGPLRAFGPGLALAVLTAMLVSVTLAPALIAIFGGLLFRGVPGGRPPGLARRGAPGGRPPGLAPFRPGTAEARDPDRTWRHRAARIATVRPVALLIAAVCVVGLLDAGLALRKARLGFPLIRALPAATQAARAQAAASRGFAPGILAPTDILVLGHGVTRQRQALARLQHSLATQPGVAGVVGPADLPAGRSLSVVLASSGDGARCGVIERTDPLGATAVDRVRALMKALPSLARSAGLAGVRFEVGGETAVTAETIDATLADLGRIALAISLVSLILLAVFLRALLAPVYLLAASVLALFAALGLTVWIFQGILGYDGLVYYVPFTVAVLLVSLGSDYNVFVVGRIWEEARTQPLRGAVAAAAPRASRAITTAGLALAASFALLALVPLDQFREIAAAMVIGIIIDTFVVRSLLVPALVVLFGRRGMWPGRRGVRRANLPAAMAEISS
jgi:putative drug exporter of the RND superfamily